MAAKSAAPSEHSRGPDQNSTQAVRTAPKLSRTSAAARKDSENRVSGKNRTALASPLEV